MRYLPLLLFSLLLLAGCASQERLQEERIYEVWEIDEPPEMVGDSIEIVAPAPLPPTDQDGGH